MRKIAIVLMVFMWFLECSSFSQEMEAIPSFVQKPEDIAKWFASEFEGQLKIPDEPQNPGQTLNLRAGDCDDFATLASKILSQLGIINFVIIIKFKGLEIRHAICVWKNQEETYDFISGRNAHYVKQGNIIKLIEKHYPDWELITFVDRDRKPLESIKRYKHIKRSYGVAYNVPLDRVSLL